MGNKSSFISTNQIEKSTSNIKKAVISSFRGFVSIDQEMGLEIAMMFFNPKKSKSFAESGHLAGKVNLSS